MTRRYVGYTETAANALLDQYAQLGLNVQARGAAGDGTTDDYAAIAEVATDLGSAGRMFFPTGTYRVGTNLTINCEAIFALGATLEPDSGVTVTLDKVTTAPGASIIASGAAGTVSITGQQNAGAAEFNVRTFGATGNGVSSDTDAVLRAFAAASAASGLKRIVFPYGTYSLALCETLTVPDNCVVDLGGSIINVPTFATTDEVVFDMGNDSVLQNGTIAVTLAGTPTSGDKNVPVRLGLYREYPSGRANVTLRNLFLDGTNAGLNSNLIAVFGNTEGLLVENVRCEGGGRVGRAFLAHWSAADPATPVVSSHPHNITIDGFYCTNLATAYGDGGAVCLSACYAVDIRNVLSDGGYLVLNFLPGDWGADFADASEASLIGTGIVATCCVGRGTLRGVSVIGLPTISGAAIDYPVRVVSSSFRGTSDVSHNGILLQTCRGVSVQDSVVENFNNGLSVGDNVDDLAVIGGHWRGNRATGLRLTDSDAPPKNPRVIGAAIYLNNTAGQAGDERAGINCAVSEDAYIAFCTFGATSSETQFYSVRTTSSSARPVLIANHTLGLASSGVAYSIGNSTDYNIGAVGFGNTAESGLTLRGGAPMSLARDAGTNLTRAGRFIGLTVAPISGTFIQGDAVWRANPVATGPTGWVCTTAGTPGTWTPAGHTVGVSADRGNTDVTLSIVTDVPTQLFNTALTADRAVSLPVNSSVITGAKYRIVRQAGATGAFNLNVGTGPLKALAAAGEWCDVEYNGSAWVLTAYGTL